MILHTEFLMAITRVLIKCRCALGMPEISTVAHAEVVHGLLDGQDGML